MTQPLSRQAGPGEIAAHDRRAAELARCRLGAITSTDPDGYHRAMCPAALGKVRCPAKPAPLTLPFDRPDVTAPDDLPPCCTQSTITVTPEVNAKTAQKHTLSPQPPTGGPTGGARPSSAATRP